ncbi:MAG: hypothetical protein KDD48_09085 [Bdellovibrionales bacterium]|nr:hypothetical protein [Bdellovibrionales bacterium]
MRQPKEMPHAEINYSNDISIDFNKLFVAIENTINQLDPSAGICKCRAYPSATYRHTHVLVTVSLLIKSHRDEVFTQELMKALELTIKSHLKKTCYFSLLITYNPSQYITNHHNPSPS